MPKYRYYDIGVCVDEYSCDRCIKKDLITFRYPASGTQYWTLNITRTGKYLCTRCVEYLEKTDPYFALGCEEYFGNPEEQ